MQSSRSNLQSAADISPSPLEPQGVKKCPFVKGLIGRHSASKIRAPPVRIPNLIAIVAAPFRVIFGVIINRNQRTFYAK